MNSKPMTYDCLRTVLYYIESNKRIQCAIQIPSIRKLEKTLPLRIRKLSFSENFFVINQTEYLFGVVRHYDSQETPLFIQSQNEKGGCKNDIDKYGFEDKDTWNKPMPGDIVMNAQEVEEPRRDINTIRVREQEIGELEMELPGLHNKITLWHKAQKEYISEEQAVLLRSNAIQAKYQIDQKMEKIERAPTLPQEKPLCLVCGAIGYVSRNGIVRCEACRVRRLTLYSKIDIFAYSLFFD
ncbi:unnamed protein product [Caenorhabditis brenneri]